MSASKILLHKDKSKNFADFEILYKGFYLSKVLNYIWSDDSASCMTSNIKERGINFIFICRKRKYSKINLKLLLFYTFRNMHFNEDKEYKQYFFSYIPFS